MSWKERTRGWPTIASTLVVLLLVMGPVVGLVVSTFQGDVDTRWDALLEKSEDGSFTGVEPVILDRVVNSLILALVATGLSLLFSVPLAIGLHRTEFFGRRVLGVLYVAPLLIPPHIHGISWLRIFGNKGYITAWWNERFESELDVRAGFWDDSFFPGATWLVTSSFWPLAALVISAGLNHLDPRHEESALIARGRRAMLRGVTLPLVRPHILAGAFFVFIFSIGCYGVPALLDTPTIMIEVFFTASNVDPTTAAVVALPLVLLTVGGLAWITFSCGKQVWGGTSRTHAVPAALRPRSPLMGCYCWFVVLLTAGWPLASLLRVAGPLETYRSIFKNVLPDIQGSLLIASTSAVAICVAGVIVALAAHRAGRRRGFLVEALALLPFAFPAVIVGVATNVFWSGFGESDFIDRYIYRGAGIGMLMYVMLFLPFAVRAVRTALDRVGRHVIEAAEVSGRSGPAVLWRVVLPMIRPGVAAALLLGFILSLGELGAGLTARPPDWDNAQVRVFNMIHFSRDEEVAALCVMLVLLVLIPTALYSLVFNRKVEVL